MDVGLCTFDWQTLRDSHHEAAKNVCERIEVIKLWIKVNSGLQGL